MAVIEKDRSSHRPVIDIQWGVDSSVPGINESAAIHLIAACAKKLALPDFEVAIRIVDEAEMIRLNHRFRDQKAKTNVLSFPNGSVDEAGSTLLGDVVICAPVVCAEATAQHKTTESHFAHMLIHGMLHLHGYDHLEADAAVTMEAIEVSLMEACGFANPYEEIEVL